jgi:hypothetical protein
MRNSITDFDIQIQSDELAARDGGDWINDFDNEEDDEFFDD